MKELEHWMDQKREKAYEREVQMRRTKMKQSFYFEKEGKDKEHKHKYMQKGDIVNPQRGTYEYGNNQTVKKEHFRLPALYREHEYDTSYRNAFETPEIKTENHTRYQQRRNKTEQSTEPPRKSYGIKNAEDWHTQMKKYQDQKFNEVY